MRLFDTARGRVVPFQPAGREALIYTCGITPYDATHLGHAFTFVVFDVLHRALVDQGWGVRMVRNVTDVDDPLFDKAKVLGIDYRELAEREERRFEADLDALNVLPVYSTPRASSAIAEIVELTERVLGHEMAYVAGPHGQTSVYFDVERFAQFGSLSGYTTEEMLELARQRGGNVDDPNKRRPLDFVLWQRSTDDEPGWDSPWGRGRPGWHIECSALALRDLGPTIDLHGGGDDLIFPHHECERAQSEAASGVPFVRHWMHVAMVHKDGEKMSKSLGNLVFVDQLRAAWEPAAVRLLLLEHHYRREWNWDERMPQVATARLTRWRESTASGRGDGRDGLAEVREHLADDLNTIAALEVLDDVAGRGHSVQAGADLLGVRLTPR